MLYERNRVFDIVSEINSAASIESVVNKFIDYVSDFGFKNFLFTGLPCTSEDFKDQIYLNGWSQEWFRLYLEKNFYQYDPIATHTRGSIHPFRWSSVWYDRTDHNSQAVMDAACEFSMRDGFCVPIFGVGGQQSCVTIAAERPELNDEIEASIHLISIYAHYAICELSTNLNGMKRLLSEREREVLKWVSDGKTNWEIGEILGISQRTVHGHIQNASQKLGTFSRTSVVVKAIKSGEIPLL